MHNRAISKKALNTEDCLEIAAGISDLKYHQDPDINVVQGFKLHKDNANIMFSIAKQVFRGVALTDKQYVLAKKLLLEYYQDQFEAHGIDLKEAVEKLRSPLRKIDSSHWIKRVKRKDRYNFEHDTVAIRFPFNKKVIKYIEELKNNNDKEYAYDKHTHYFPYKEKYIWKLVNIANKFENKFEIDEAVLNVYDVLKSFNQNPQDYIPGIYNFNFKHLPEKAQDICLLELGQPNYQNLYQYYDRKDYYGLVHFDETALSKSRKNLTTLTNKVLNREGNLICVNSNTWQVSQVLEMVDELKRYPLLILLDQNKCYEELSLLNSLFTNYVPRNEMSVMFRMDTKKGNNAIQFNRYVTTWGLNNSVDKNTRIVYISNNKVPKPLLKKGFRPKGIFQIGSKKTPNTINDYVHGHDFIIQYDQDVSPHYGYGYYKADMI